MTEQKRTVEISYPPDEEEVSEVKNKGTNKMVSKTTPKKKPAQKKHQKKMKDQKELIEKLEKERDEYKDNYLRNLAEIDNFRKRVKKEKEEFQKFALNEFFLELLPIVDNLERALKSKEGSGENSVDEQSIVSGVEMIFKQLLDLLKKYKVEEIEALGRIFDPNLHQALSKEEKEGITDSLVVEVYQKGFLYNDKLLRPSLAKVAIPLEEEDDDERLDDDE
ncbi:MAG: nucleotide exchange factor GrpE [Candidatus Aminicenantes bacterium]|nr:nucleotide exchange factor GrpE [Candidatus Aminicenantes bacterium]